MEDIKIGEYIRIRGEILQIEVICNRTEKDMYIKFKEYASGNTFNINEIVKWKHSKNIIDLIEVGDYLDGVRVDSIEKDENGVFFIQNYDLPAFDLKNIKSIVTKEQFKSVEYEV